MKVLFNHKINKSMKFKKYINLLTMSVLGLFSYAQTTIVPLGGDVYQNGSSISYTIGQIACDYVAETTGSMSVGVQQPYEIFTVGIDNHPAITLSMSVYPNPTAHGVTLRIVAESVDNLNHLQGYLYDVTGKVLSSVTLQEQETRIHLEPFPASVYFLKVTNHREITKIFKIIKH
jgi:hypothetical protein